MPKRKIIYSTIFLLIVLAGILSAIIFYNNQELKIYFLDVGQGDAILISQGQNQILIDGGPSGQKLMEKLGRYIPFWDRKIELMIVTHPDQDHIEGLISALQNYQVEEIMENSKEAESQVYKNLENLIQEKNVNQIEAQARTKIKIGENAELEIIYASKNNENKKENNSESIVSKLIFGKDSFLLTGDLPSEEEINLSNIEADILKVAHHGSKYSTSEEFLGRIKPEMAVISVGKNNKFGHPAGETLERLRNKNMKILRTDERGDVKFICRNVQEKCQLIAN